MGKLKQLVARLKVEEAAPQLPWASQKIHHEQAVVELPENPRQSVQRILDLLPQSAVGVAMTRRMTRPCRMISCKDLNLKLKVQLQKVRCRTRPGQPAALARINDLHGTCPGI